MIQSSANRRLCYTALYKNLSEDAIHQGTVMKIIYLSLLAALCTTSVLTAADLPQPVRQQIIAHRGHNVTNHPQNRAIARQQPKPLLKRTSSLLALGATGALAATELYTAATCGASDTLLARTLMSVQEASLPSSDSLMQTSIETIKALSYIPSATPILYWLMRKVGLQKRPTGPLQLLASGYLGSTQQGAVQLILLSEPHHNHRLHLATVSDQEVELTDQAVGTEHQVLVELNPEPAVGYKVVAQSFVGEELIRRAWTLANPVTPDRVIETCQQVRDLQELVHLKRTTTRR